MAFGRRWGALAASGVIALWAGMLAPAQSAEAASDDSFHPRGAAPGLSGGGRGRVRVALLLQTPTAALQAAARQRSALAPAPGAGRRRFLNGPNSKSAVAYSRAQRDRRARALRLLATETRRLAARQVPAYRAVIAAGGQIEGVSVLGQRITATVPRAALPRLSRRADVRAVAPIGVSRPLNLGQESAAVGAPTWWAVHNTGGRGLADVPANFAVVQDPVLHSHPAFSGLSFETPPGAALQTSPSITRHGTALLSIAAARVQRVVRFASLRMRRRRVPHRA